MQPTPAQKRVLDATESATRPVLWLGAIRAGKTVGAVMALLRAIERQSGQYLLAGYTYGSLERNVLPVLNALLEDGGYDDFTLKRSYPWRLEIAGSTIWFMGASDESSQNALQGMTLDGAVIDECLLVPQSFIMQCVARLSHDHSFLLMTANKEAPNHWLKRQWIDADLVTLFESSLDDNPHIGEKARGRYEALLQGAYADRMLGNEWAGSGNLICRVESPPPQRCVFSCVYVHYQDRSSHDAYILGHCVVYGDNRWMEFDLSDSVYQPAISNITDTASVGLWKISEKDAALALSLHPCWSDDQAIREELESLSWVARDKPCEMSPLAMACGMAADRLRHGASVFDAPVWV